MEHDDLPLFRWKPPTAEMIPFPCRARVGKIRRTAQLLDDSLTDRAADARWRQAADGIARQMERAGIPEDRVQAELRDFSDAVCAEIARRSHGRNFYRPEDGEIA